MHNANTFDIFIFQSAFAAKLFNEFEANIWMHCVGVVKVTLVHIIKGLRS